MRQLPHAVLESAKPHVLGLYRIVIGLLFTCHGTASLFGFPDGGRGTLSAGEWPGWYAAVIQLVGGGLVLLGLGTRPAAFLSSGSMAYAYFTEHQKLHVWPIQNGGELSVLFCWSLLLIVVFGSGSFALERVPARVRAGRSTTSARPTDSAPAVVR
ncbi:DoxX family protein [Embleya sp. AB8]|uniref:DoxX family protein n=1 Tax=Embleya sp. AB8 TaxID=3156304 RepID=UPI003C728155